MEGGDRIVAIRVRVTPIPDATRPPVVSGSDVIRSLSAADFLGVATTFDDPVAR